MVCTLGVSLLIYLLCFFAVWYGAGFIIQPVVSIARFTRLPSFVLSFFLLGLLTSLPEISIGVISLTSDTPDVFVGTMLGGIIVMILGVIPLLGIIGNGVQFPWRMDTPHLLFYVATLLLPFVVLFNQQLEQFDGIVLLIWYGLLFLSLWKRKEPLEAKGKKTNLSIKKASAQFVRIAFGIGLLLIGSKVIVSTTMYLSTQFQISPFLVSLLALAIGTNIPEISLIVRSLIAKKKELALGDYLGSAVANVLLLGLFRFAYQRPIDIPNHFLIRFSLFFVGAVLFFLFASSKRRLSRSECAILLCLYMVFVVLEFVVN